MIEMPVELPTSEKPSVALANFQLPPAFAPATYIRRWLSDLRVSPRERARQFWTQINSRDEEMITESHTAHRPSGMSDRSGPEQLDKNWVYVVKALSEPELDMPSHLQPMLPPGGQHPHVNIPVVEGDSNHIAPEQRPLNSNLSSPPPYPNLTCMAPVKPPGDVAISRSV